MRDDRKSVTLVQGTLHMLILNTLKVEPLHGYGLGERLKQMSRGVFCVNPGSLIPALTRLERAGLIESDWRITRNSRRAKYYWVTAVGRTALARQKRDWQVQTTAIARILQGTPETR